MDYESMWNTLSRVAEGRAKTAEKLREDSIAVGDMGKAIAAHTAMQEMKFVRSIMDRIGDDHKG